MNPIVTNIVENNHILEFSLQNTDVSVANAIRRTILSEIDVNAFVTETFEKNQCTIHKNTSRFHNEIVKQRLSCIPIHMEDLDILPGKYLLEVEKRNEDSNNIYVTTEDFKIKNKETNQYLTRDETKKIFPPNELTGDYICFLRLRPQIASNILGEEIKLECEFSTSNAKDNSMFNVVSLCSFGNTIDKVKVQKEWLNRESKYKQDGLSETEIKFEKKNFMLLDAQRQYIKDSFDFTIKSLNVFSNKSLVFKSCEQMKHKLEQFDHDVDADIVFIRLSENTMKNCYDIVVDNEDYTLGKILEYGMYKKYFEKEKLIEYCGFKKFHPHDKQSVIRIAYASPIDRVNIKQQLKTISKSFIDVFSDIQKMFS